MTDSLHRSARLAARRAFRASRCTTSSICARYQILRRYDALRAAFERWVHDDPHNASPYGTYARMLIELGQPATADSIIERGRVALGTARDLQYETAQLRAAMGDWEPSASAWRRALANDAGLASAAAYSLAPAPPTVRPALRSILWRGADRTGLATRAGRARDHVGTAAGRLGSAPRAAARTRRRRRCGRSSATARCRTNGTASRATR